MKNSWINLPIAGKGSSGTNPISAQTWTIEPLGDSPWIFANKFSIDYLKKEISVSVYATDSQYLEDWLRLHDKNLLFKCYDGGHSIIYEIGIFEVSVNSVEENYNYVNTSILETKLSATFNKFNKVWY